MEEHLSPCKPLLATKAHVDTCNSSSRQPYPQRPPMNLNHTAFHTILVKLPIGVFTIKYSSGRNMKSEVTG